MPRITYCLLAGLLWLALLSVCPACAGGSVLLTTGEWAPFFSEALPHGGVGNRIVSASFKQVGVEVEFLYQPWIRAMQTARFGPAVGSSGWLRTPDRERHFVYSAPIFTSRRVFFHRRDYAFDWKTLDDIRDLRVAATLGSADEFPFEDILAKGRGEMDIAYSYDSGMRKLAAGRVDIYACNLDVGMHALRHQVDSHEASLITCHPRLIFAETNHLIISKRLPNAYEIIEQFNRGLKKLKESGRYDSILNDPLGRIPVE